MSLAQCRRGVHFYPRPPRGGRQQRRELCRNYYPFLSTPSARRATGTGDLKAASGVFLSTPSARRATQFRKSK